MQDTLTLCTWNTAGLGNRVKRNLILRELLCWDANVIFLQEIKAKALECKNTKGWLGEEFDPIWDAHLTRFCAILIRKGTFSTVKTVFEHDRCLMIEATCTQFLPSESDDQASKLIHLTCLYAPQQAVPRKAFFQDEYIWRLIPNTFSAQGDTAPTRFDVVAGDFNDFPHLRDIQPHSTNEFSARRKWTSIIGPLFSSKGIVDPLREQVSTLMQGDEDQHWDSDMIESPFWTRRQANPPIQSRVDHILLSRTFGRMYDYSPDRYYTPSSSTLSDHSILLLALQLPSSQQDSSTSLIPRQKNWTLHPYWLQDSQTAFRERTESYIRSRSRNGAVKERISQLHTATAYERWRVYKDELIINVKGLTQTLPRAVKPSDRLGAQWQEAKAKLKSMVDGGKIGTREYYQQRDRAREFHELVVIEERCKIKDRLNSLEQVPSSFVSARYSRSSKQRQITSLRDESGIAQRDQQQMLLIAHRFYSNLYATPKVDFHALQELMAGGRQSVLSQSQCKQAVKPFTKDHFLDAAKKLNDKSMPGEDGIPTLFYTKFPQAIDELVIYCNKVLLCPEEAFIPHTPQLEVSLLPKKGDTSDLANRRPIALINTCDRISSNAMATRFNTTKIAHAILPPNQTAYVKGRLIFDSILCIQLFISASLLGLTQEDQVIIFLDQEKAFDRIAQRVIIKSLKAYGMPKQVIKWFEKLWDGAEAQYKINGQLSDKVPIKRGVLQGNPDSALVYCFASAIILDYLSRHHVAFAYCSRSDREARQYVDTPAYADDWAVVISETSIGSFFKCMALAERSAGTKINVNKTLYLYLPAQEAVAEHEGATRQDGIAELADAAGQENRWKPALPFDQIDPTADYRYLGGFIRGDGQSATASHLALIHASKKGMLKWQSMTLSFYGRVKLVNTFYLSKLWHTLGSAGGIDESAIIKALKAILIEIIFGTPQALIRLSTLAMPYKDGGLNLLLPTHMLTAMAGRDLIRSLSGATHSSELFRQCMEAQSQAIGLTSAAWLERNNREWIQDRKKFQPMWLRLSKAADILDLTACPVDNTLDQLLLSPWLERGVYKHPPNITRREKTTFRQGRLLTWNNILDINPAHSRQIIIPLESAKASINTIVNLPVTTRAFRRKAWNLLHKQWPAIWDAMKDEWKVAIRGHITIPRPQRHWLLDNSYINMRLPPHLLLAGVPALQYSVHTARRYQTDKERDVQILPARHRPLQRRRMQKRRECANSFEIDDTSDISAQDSSNLSGTDSEDEAGLEVLFGEATITLHHQRDKQNQQDKQDRQNDDEAVACRRRQEATKFYITLDKCMRRHKLPPDVYSSIYSIHQGRKPYLGKHVICCQEETATRVHSLFSCCRAIKVWNNMRQVAYDIGLSAPTLSQGECVELFPDWLAYNTAPKYHRKDWASAKTSEAQIKMLLIATHAHILLKFMFKPVSNEEGEVAACLKQIKALLLDFPYIQEQTESTRQVRRTAAARRYGLFKELEPESETEESGSDNDDQEDQEGHIEANGEINFWHLW